MTEANKDLIMRVSMLAVLVVACSIGYYFLFSLPQQRLLENDIKCQEMGMKIYLQEVKDSGFDSYLKPEFKFVESLGACLYSGAYNFSDSLIYFVKNVYTNKELVRYTYEKETGRVSKDKHDYDLFVKKYFEE